MNKYQEALDNAINDIEYKHHDFGVDVPKERLDEIKLLQKLVDKEKPMNICFKRIGNEDVPYCPRCKRRLVDDHLTYYNYCPDCGQRLD